MQYEELRKKSSILSWAVNFLQRRRWQRKLCYFYKIFKEQSANYHFIILPKEHKINAVRNSKDVPQCRTNDEYFKSLFFSTTIKERNILDSYIRSSERLNVFENKILQFIRPETNSFFNFLNPKEAKLFARLSIGLSHLWYSRSNIIFKTASTLYGGICNPYVVLKSK